MVLLLVCFDTDGLRSQPKLSQMPFKARKKEDASLDELTKVRGSLAGHRPVPIGLVRIASSGVGKHVERADMEFQCQLEWLWECWTSTESAYERLMELEERLRKVREGLITMDGSWTIEMHREYYPWTWKEWQ